MVVEPLDNLKGKVYDMYMGELDLEIIQDNKVQLSQACSPMSIYYR